MGTKGKRNKNEAPAGSRTVPVGLRLPGPVAAKLRSDAIENGRTLSGHIIFHLRQAGALNAPER